MRRPALFLVPAAQLAHQTFQTQAVGMRFRTLAAAFFVRFVLHAHLVAVPRVVDPAALETTLLHNVPA